MLIPRFLIALSAFAIALTTAISLGQTSATAPATQPASEAEVGSQEAVLRELMESGRGSVRVTPAATQPAVRDVPTRIAVPAAVVGAGGAGMDPDPAVIGVAPGEPRPTLRREGEFVINRAGRLVRSSDQALSLFVFEADAAATPEPPMILQACRLLETMEDVVSRHGDSTVFVISGQVHTYRGNNYLLPTRMTPRIDRGNLSP
ncbi:MAG: hypothetical protein AAF797_04565 [Planctomycetota bacterium]